MGGEAQMVWVCLVFGFMLGAGAMALLQDRKPKGEVDCIGPFTAEIQEHFTVGQMGEQGLTLEHMVGPMAHRMGFDFRKWLKKKKFDARQFRIIIQASE